jgi:hypothetical protein
MNDFYLTLDIAKTLLKGTEEYEYEFPRGKLEWTISISEEYGPFLYVIESKNVKSKLLQLINIICGEYDISVYSCIVDKLSVLPISFDSRIIYTFSWIILSNEFFKLRDPSEYKLLIECIIRTNVGSRLVDLSRRDVRYFNKYLGREALPVEGVRGKEITLTLPLYISTFVELAKLYKDYTFIPTYLVLYSKDNGDIEKIRPSREELSSQVAYKSFREYKRENIFATPEFFK